MRIETCRGCGRDALSQFMSFGSMPLADGFLRSAAAITCEERYPLDLAWCSACSLVQVLDTVPREIVFSNDYAYHSSYSSSLRERSAAHAAKILASHDLDANALVVEIACNDGYLLEHFPAHDLNLIGVEPAPGPCAAARAKGLSVIRKFFGAGLAAEIRRDAGAAAVVIANNVLAHVENLHDFLDGLRLLLADDGIAIIEVHYVKALIEGIQFDTIYHEHLCYFSALSLSRLLAQHGLHPRDVELLDTQGGSLRVTASPRPRRCGSLDRLIALEQAAGLDRLDRYHSFSKDVDDLKIRIFEFVSRLRTAGGTIAGYGAAAKGTMLLNACGIGPDIVEHVIDMNPHKHGSLIPGVHIPIVAVDTLRERRPDFVLLLPWNLKDEILTQETAYRAAGGRFIVPLPVPVLV